MEMKNWILGLVLLGIAIPVIKSEHLKDESDRGFLGQRKFSFNPPKEGDGFLGIPDSNQNEEVDQELDDEAAVENLSPAGLLIRETDLKGNAGILVIQNGPSSSLPLMFELRPVRTDPKGSFDESDDEDIPEQSEEDGISDESGVMIVSNNRFKPSSSLYVDSEEDEEYDDDQDMSPPKRRIRPTVKPKRKQTNQVSKPSKKSKRPVSQPIQRKRKRNQNKVQNQKKNKNKNKNQYRKRKPNNQRKRLQTGSNLKTRRKNSSNRDSMINHNANRRKHLGVRVNKGSGSQTVTNTVTTTQTGSADDEPNVNYIVINKPAPASTTEKPFWDILGRSAGNDETDRSFNPRKGFTRRSLG